MKIFKKVIIIVLLVVISIGLLFIGNGYNMYKSAIEETSLNEKVEEIREKDNYTKLSELP